ncbi:hypothetical protein TREMEDRAFT_65197 [Tremella mesenterica DSM 1558]|uniref:uncharacterized protein n=1 Tax=Tremella mesenterica (strain ATCC 24925 / CBS 8224 / DSM 1558 / NBRC 9311 / NRRL Y-6157 / RJB 2259-6 / UBC 559-6) TaxID=578456 RepID=UPI00032CE16A|nr:uncharacterized protein TREMEDRAFT_65197 [Tremella mesenterica DSM 1558]EIW66795.1 hypothetical protein TREMEDRAFT_65197 [Tremella mesenterica DSM 1558]
MAKRTSDAAGSESNGKVQDRGQGIPREGQKVDDEMGEFEDRWEDDIESEEDMQEGENDDFTPAMEDDQPSQPRKQTYLPGTKLDADEQLTPDLSVYLLLHSLSYAWPCLSFDILHDDLGSSRTSYPHTAFIVSGTQAGTIPGQGRAKDEVVIMRLSGLSKTQQFSDSDSENESNDENDIEEDSKLDFLTIPHIGNVNRIRAAPTLLNSTIPDPYHVATFSETGKVHIFDVRPYIDTLSGPSKPRQKVPIHTINNHDRSEGFALEWGQSGLLSGDCDGKIYRTVLTETGFKTEQKSFLGHENSVEDIQWSPNEMGVFASCSADKTVKMWDVRQRSKPALSVMAHDEDVNVISWNKEVDYLLVSGGDEGGIKVWDLRMFKQQPSPVAHFTWHTAPITSVEWDPNDSSVFAASGADDQLTLWDLSVEQDDDEVPISSQDGQNLSIPPQLLFVHQGQRDVKELHWHPQIPGVVISTASDSFNVFRTISS